MRNASPRTSRALSGPSGWGRHELYGMQRNVLAVHPGLQERIEASDRYDADFVCAVFILHTRAPVIAHILAGEPTQCVRVEIGPEDVANVRIMGPNPPALERFSLDAVRREDSLGE